MKKLVSTILLLTLALTLLAGCGGGASSSTASTAPEDSSAPASSDAASAQTATEREPHKIAVAFNAINNAELDQKAYLENYIGPAFNVEFVFSEAIADTDALITFIENSYASGCEAIMNFQSDGMEQGTAKAQELGMYIISNNNYIAESVADMPFNMGCIGTSVPGTAALFGEAVEYLTDDGNQHNVLIVSGGAALGNNQHLQSTIAILQTLQDKFALTYDTDIETLAKSQNQTEVNTGTDMKIMIYPGYAGNDTYVPGISTILQTGEYDIVLCTYTAYTQYAVAVDEVEREYGIDIKQASIAPVGDGTKNSFTTTDSQGSPSLDVAIIKPNAVLTGAMFTILYNALEGNADAIRQDGKASQYHLVNWIAYGPEGYETIEQLDVAPETYALKVADIEALLVSSNGDANYDALYGTFGEMTAESVAAASGL